MNKYITLTVAVLALLGAASANINDQPVAHYTLGSEFADSTGNNQLAQNFGTTWTKDQNGLSDYAVSFSGQKTLLKFPNSAIYALVDYTICFWTKSNEISSINRVLVHIESQTNQNLISFQQENLKIGSSIKSQQFPLNYNLITGNWQHICLSRDSANKQYNIFADGQLFQTIDTTEVEDGFSLDTSDFNFGYHEEEQGQVFDEKFQYYGSLSDFRIYSKAITADDAQLIKIDRIWPKTDDQTCANYLAELQPSLITEQFTLPYVAEKNQHYHYYNINFNTFNFDQTCFKSQIYLGNKPIYHYVNNNQITIQFPWEQAFDKGCIQLNPTQQQCQFRLQIYHKDKLQFQKLFTSIINTPNLDDLTEQLSLNIINDEDQSLLQFDYFIDPTMNLCSDITCTKYIYPTEIIRNTDLFIEFNVRSHGFNQYYPIHKRLTIDGLNVQLQNQAAIDLWQEQGRIIYHIKPPVASPNALLVIGISLSRTNPHGGRRLIQDQENKQLEEQKGNVGKYIRIQIVDQDGKIAENLQKNDDDSDNDNYVTIAIVGAVAALLLTVSLAGIGVFYKLRKNKPNINQNSKNQGQQLEPTSPNSIDSRENKLNIQVQ